MMEKEEGNVGEVGIYTSLSLVSRGSFEIMNGTE